MDDSDRVEPTAVGTTGFAATVQKLISRQVEVQGNEPIGSSFRLITVGGESLQHRNWAPGDIFQIAFPNWESRAYTPFAFDSARGSAQFLGYVHGNGKGSAWLAAASVGEQRFLVGPRTGVNLSTLRRPAFFFGDETSFSTAAALHATPRGIAGVQFVFEVSANAAAQSALERLGLVNDVTLIQREAHDRHLEQLEGLARQAFRSNPALCAVLTGSAPSIRRLYKALRGVGLPSKQATNLAYWAPDRRGFSGIQR